MSALSVFCADIGSVRNDRFGWYGRLQDGSTVSGSRPGELAASVVESVRSGAAIALGFECPLFVPVPVSEEDLGRARTGEGNRSWSAGAGSGALATGLVQVAWVLRAVRAAVPDAEFSFDADTFARAPKGILVWEAMVTGAAHGDSHIADARAAVDALVGRSASGQWASDVSCEPALSLAAAALLFAGGTAASAVGSQCLVIRV